MDFFITVTKNIKKMIKSISKTMSLVILLITINVNAQTTFNADVDHAVINWKGFKPTGEHYGTIKLKSGNFKVNNNTISGGEFTIDMNSMVVVDLPAESEYNAKLTGHLKSDDFFGVAKFPTASFIITSTEKKEGKHLVKGDLTIKGITNPVEFLAEVNMGNDKMTFKSETFKIDRSKWDIKYKSTSFFDSLGDKFIYDDMEISVVLEAKK